MDKQDSNLSYKHKLFIDLFFKKYAKTDKASAYGEVYSSCKASNRAKQATLLIQKLEKTDYFQELEKEFAESLCLNRAEQLRKLQEVHDLAIEGSPIINKDGDIVGNKKDLKSACSAIAEQNKVLGFHAPVKHDIKGDVSLSAITVNFVDK